MCEKMWSGCLHLLAKRFWVVASSKLPPEQLGLKFCCWLPGILLLTRHPFFVLGHPTLACNHQYEQWILNGFSYPVCLCFFYTLLSLRGSHSIMIWPIHCQQYAQARVWEAKSSWIWNVYKICFACFGSDAKKIKESSDFEAIVFMNLKFGKRSIHYEIAMTLSNYSSTQSNFPRRQTQVYV